MWQVFKGSLFVGNIIWEFPDPLFPGFLFLLVRFGLMFRTVLEFVRLNLGLFMRLVSEQLWESRSELITLGPVLLEIHHNIPVPN